MALELNKQLNEGTWNVSLSGEVDIYTASELKKTVTVALDEKLGDIEFDCSKLTYIDSTGLGVLIGFLKKLDQQYKIIIKNPKNNIIKLLKITGLDKIFVIEN